MYVVRQGGQGIILHVPFYVMDYLCMSLSCFGDPQPNREVMQARILKQSELLHEVLKVRYLCGICLVQISWCISEVDNPKFQILQPLKLSPWAELKSLAVKLTKEHLSFGLLEGCFHFQKLQEEGFNIQELLILPGTDVPSLLLFSEGEELLIRNL
jgi:hypothetical protein